MESKLDMIIQGSIVSVKGTAYIPIAKAKYVTEQKPKDWYAKIFFKNHLVLVISPSDNFAYFGKDIGSIGVKPPFKSIIEYQNCRYKRVTKDYQIVKSLDFGSPLETEGEVKFWDYQSDDENHLLSLAIVQRTQKRSDIVADVISPSDILVNSSKN